MYVGLALFKHTWLRENEGEKERERERGREEKEMRTSLFFSVLAQSGCVLHASLHIFH